MGGKMSLYSSRSVCSCLKTKQKKKRLFYLRKKVTMRTSSKYLMFWTIGDLVTNAEMNHLSFVVTVSATVSSTMQVQPPKTAFLNFVRF